MYECCQLKLVVFEGRPHCGYALVMLKFVDSRNVRAREAQICCRPNQLTTHKKKSKASAQSPLSVNLGGQKYVGVQFGLWAFPYYHDMILSVKEALGPWDRQGRPRRLRVPPPRLSTWSARRPLRCAAPGNCCCSRACANHQREKYKCVWWFSTCSVIYRYGARCHSGFGLRTICCYFLLFFFQFRVYVHQVVYDSTYQQISKTPRYPLLPNLKFLIKDITMTQIDQLSLGYHFYKHCDQCKMSNIK